MSVPDQNIRLDSYKIIPRTLCFLLREDQLLLLRIASDRDSWSGQLNGIGGHIRRGEDPLSSAQREILEETGLSASDLRLCGVILIDVQDKVGVGLYVFVGRSPSGDTISSEEGEPEWVHLKSLNQVSLVEDLPFIIPRALDSYKTGEPFSAIYSYDEHGEIKISILP